MIIPRALAEQARFATAVSEIEPILRPHVVRIRYTLGNDWSGEPAVFFRITLSDAASKRDQLLNVTNQISAAMEQRIEPLEQWEVYPYFNFRIQSEQAVLHDEAWA